MLISDITRKFSVTKPKPLPARLDIYASRSLVSPTPFVHSLFMLEFSYNILAHPCLPFLLDFLLIGVVLS